MNFKKKSPDAANLLILWAFLDNQDIWYELFTPALDCNITEELPDWFSRCVGNQFEFTKCTRFLIRYSFVSANIESLSLSVHSVLHCWCFHSSDKRKNEIAWLAIMVVASAAPTESNIDYTLLQRRLLSNCNRVYSLLHLNIPENMSKSFDLLLINACHRLAALYSYQGKMAEAEALYLWALTEKEKIWGPDHTSTLDTVNNLGLPYSNKGKIAEAEAIYLRALPGYEKAWGADHASTLGIVNNLGLLYSDQGKMADAEAMYLRALAGREKAWAPNHRNTLDTRYNLAGLLEGKFMLQDAAKHFELVVQGYTKLLGPEHPETVDASDRLKRCEDASSGTGEVDRNDGDDDGSNDGGGGKI